MDCNYSYTIDDYTMVMHLQTSSPKLHRLESIKHKSAKHTCSTQELHDNQLHTRAPCMYTHIYTNMHAHMHTRAPIRIRTHAHTYTQAHTYMCVRVRVCMCGVCPTIECNINIASFTQSADL